MKGFIKMVRGICLLLGVLTFQALIAQRAFDEKWLQMPEKYGEQLLSMFTVSEVPVFEEKDQPGYLVLHNGYGVSEIFDSEKLESENAIDVVSVTLVYSRYPLVNGTYEEIFILLADRLIELFTIAPWLNDPDIEWNIVRQTSCTTQSEAAALFHGIIIMTDDAHIPDSLSSVTDFDDNYDSFFAIPDTVLSEIDSLDDQQRKVIIEEHLTISINQKRHIKSKGTLKYVKSFSAMNSFNDSTVYKVMDRNKDRWDSILVVVDWTGSMYAYGAQIVDWHHKHYENSPLSFFSIFNDGDMSSSKIIGNTGGIYMIEANNVDAVIETFYLVGSRGFGGDAPENDVEAIQAGMEYFEGFRDIILIADNSCMRDFELLDSLDQPIHVILCGYNEKWGINDQYVELAIATGGSLHTIDEDIWSFDKAAFNDHYTIGITPLYVVEDYCSFKFSNRPKLIKQVALTDVNELRKHQNDLISLNLSSKSLEKIPGKIFTSKRMVELDVSDNLIVKIPKRIERFKLLKVLNLSGNNIEDITVLCRLHTLSELNLGDNKITELPTDFRLINKLEVLNLQNNQLVSLKNLRHTRLLSLDASGNQIEKIDNGLLSSKKMTYLNLSNNKITALPKSFYRLKSLEILDLSNNLLRTVPSGIVQLKKLRYINLAGNPIPENDLLQLARSMPWVEVVY
jgi:hypothetical protein